MIVVIIGRIIIICIHFIIIVNISTVYNNLLQKEIYIEDTSIVIRKKFGIYRHTRRVMKRRAVTGGPIKCVENHSDNVTNPNGSEGKLLFDLIFNLVSLIY